MAATVTHTGHARAAGWRRLRVLLVLAALHCCYASAPYSPQHAEPPPGLGGPAGNNLPGDAPPRARRDPRHRPYPRQSPDAAARTAGRQPRLSAARTAFELEYPGLHAMSNTTRHPLSASDARHTADLWYSKQGRQAYDALLRAPSGRNVYFCFPCKNGSTRWKYSMVIPTFGRGTQLGRARNYMPPILTEPQALEVMADPATLRFMWVRDPYARLLSAYLDKVLGQFRDRAGVPNLGGPFGDSPAEFSRFVRAVRDVKRRAQSAGQTPGLDRHWVPQSFTCGVQHGATYHFYLKVEEVSEWYVDLMSLMGLDDTVRPGPHAKGRGDCFFKLPGHDCASMATLISQHMGNVSNGLRPEVPHDVGAGGTPDFMLQGNTGHAQSASRKVREYYSTQEVIDDATEYLREDLDMFGYPALRLDADACGMSGAC